MVAQTGCSERKKGDMNDYQVLNGHSEGCSSHPLMLEKTVNRAVGGEEGSIVRSELHSEYVERDVCCCCC